MISIPKSSLSNSTSIGGSFSPRLAISMIVFEANILSSSNDKSSNGGRYGIKEGASDEIISLLLLMPTRIISVNTYKRPDTLSGATPNPDLLPLDDDHPLLPPDTLTSTTRSNRRAGLKISIAPRNASCACNIVSFS